MHFKKMYCMRDVVAARIRCYGLQILIMCNLANGHLTYYGLK